eukprot:m.139452 g.139452  ORF g.139452 m.139452 type:complete len:62 (-) comp21686_c0_seq1:81-266(-)
MPLIKLNKQEERGKERKGEQRKENNKGGGEQQQQKTRDKGKFLLKGSNQLPVHRNTHMYTR